MILVNNTLSFLAQIPDISGVRTVGAIQWVCKLNRGSLRKAEGLLLFIQFGWALFPGKEPPGRI